MNHPNIVTIHDINLIKEPMYIVMEYVEGQTLWHIIHEKKTRSHVSGVSRENASPPISEKMEIREIINYAIRICHGLKAAHQKGIIHRDIKSHNILINKDGQVKILDFGLAGPIKAPSLTEKEKREQISFTAGLLLKPKNTWKKRGSYSRKWSYTRIYKS